MTLLVLNLDQSGRSDQFNWEPTIELELALTK